MIFNCNIVVINCLVFQLPTLTRSCGLSCVILHVINLIAISDLNTSHVIKLVMKQEINSSNEKSDTNNEEVNKKVSPPKQAFAALLSSGIATTLLQPLDVLKTRLQGLYYICIIC